MENNQQVLFNLNEVYFLMICDDICICNQRFINLIYTNTSGGNKKKIVCFGAISIRTWSKVSKQTLDESISPRSDSTGLTIYACPL